MSLQKLNFRSVMMSRHTSVRQLERVLLYALKTRLRLEGYRKTFFVFKACRHEFVKEQISVHLRDILSLLKREK